MDLCIFAALFLMQKMCEPNFWGNPQGAKKKKEEEKRKKLD